MTRIDRTLPALVLGRSPLVYFLAQVRFSPILSMGDHIAAVQDRFRGIGYPVFEQQEAQTVTITPQGPVIEKVTLWHFKDVAQTSSVALAQNFVSFQTFKYKRYEEEFPRIREVLDAVHSLVKFDVFERCGIRYLNVIHPDSNEGQTYQTFLQPEIIGLNGESFDVTNVMNSSVFVGTTTIGTLVVKFSTSKSPAILPLDLMGSALHFETDIPQGDAIGILDFDHFIENRGPFNVQQTEQYLAQLHDAISLVFSKCTTDEALELWGKKSVE